MASYVFMKALESSARRYDAGINILSLGQSNRINREIVRNYITARLGSAILNESDVWDSVIPPLAASTGVDVNTPAGVR